ncbi:MAG: 16S rRNA (uracil(1498)-N(3))-methyltransferase [Gammaproteobacteria bacterium]|nr:MAG: 16S rRNA (uracil(1498)-N(3))-methyltransferase [Gammaproteobacteria bacterium]
MNLILLYPSDLISATTAQLTDRRFFHIKSILKAKVGDSLRVGLIDGKMGTGIVESLSQSDVKLSLSQIDTSPPKPLPVTLLLALPRPKMLKRVLQCSTAMGVKEVHLINSYKVEKSFWGSPWLSTDRIHDNLLLGLEQAQDTTLPKVYLHKLFKPFVEDRLPGICGNGKRLVAHPYSATDCPLQQVDHITLAIGPEGGFTDYEIGKLMAQGFKPIKMGQRILRVETAVPALLAKLFPFC